MTCLSAHLLRRSSNSGEAAQQRTTVLLQISVDKHALDNKTALDDNNNESALDDDKTALDNNNNETALDNMTNETNVNVFKKIFVG